MNPISFLVLLPCYAIGCCVTAWYLVRWRTGADLRELHSGTTGARNAGRVLGRAAFAGIAVLDGLRGMLAMSLAAWAGLREWGLVLAGTAVLAGHVWPVQLGFQGGKGLAIGTGVILWLLPLRTPPEWTLVAVVIALVLWCHRSDIRSRFFAKPPP
ncbi:MAG: glycerol-3-phosphate acyltransferase [Limisphaerales bacterium]